MIGAPLLTIQTIADRIPVLPVVNAIPKQIILETKEWSDISNVFNELLKKYNFNKNTKNSVTGEPNDAKNETYAQSDSPLIIRLPIPIQKELKSHNGIKIKISLKSFLSNPLKIL